MEETRTTLVTLRPQAEVAIQNQIDDLKGLQGQSVASEEEYELASQALEAWADYTHELLKSLFNNGSIAKEFKDATTNSVFFIGEESLSTKVSDLRDDISRALAKLESIKKRLTLFPESQQSTITTTSKKSTKAASHEIFIVHGHDEAAKESVARIIEKLGLTAVILHEQASGGKTVIEKLEARAAQAGFAVVLLTPDDNVVPAGSKKAVEKHARQNVIFEFGFFMSLLTRERVVALYKEGTTIPTDINGIIYIKMSEGGGWSFELGRELKNAGYDVSLDDLA